MASASRKYLDLVSVLDEREPVGGLAEHRKHCEAEPGECPFEQKADGADVIGNANARTERLAPNGKRSNLTERQWHQVRTPEFKAWFGDWENDPANASKVLDENGEPLVLFHGTKDSSFNTFDPKKIGEWNFGFHFGTQYAAETRVEKDGQLKDVFLNARNPFRCSDGFGIPKALVFDEIAAIARGRGEDELADELVRCGDKAEELWENGFKDESRVSEECSKTFVDVLGKLGFDSVVYENEYEEDEKSGEDSWMTISPMQIKSATDNNGSFDPNNPDIRY